MRTIKDILTDAVINGNNSFDIDNDIKITEDVSIAMGEYGAMLILAQQERFDREQTKFLEWYFKRQTGQTLEIAKILYDEYKSNG